VVLDRRLEIEGLPLHKRDPVYMREVIRRAAADPLGYVSKAAIQSVAFWVLGGDRLKTVIFAALQLPLLVLCAFAVRRSLWTHRRDLLGLAVVGGYLFLVHIAGLSIARYSMPLRPWIVMLAATFIAQRLFTQAGGSGFAAVLRSGAGR